jgi:hypothetical protein
MLIVGHHKCGNPPTPGKYLVLGAENRCCVYANQ